ncbi:MAG: hypothetical protein WCX65_09595 [bacterium]
MKSVYFTIILSAAILISGCSARQIVTNEIAKNIVGVLDAQYEANLKIEPAKNVEAAQYCLSTSATVAAAVQTTGQLLNGYKTSVQGDTKSEAIAAQIGTLQSNLKNCAYVRCKNVAGDEVSALRNLAGALGFNAGVEPPADSCKKYEKLSREINKKVSK